jgi:hypothetical protein
MNEFIKIILPLPNKWLSPNKTIGSRGQRMAKWRYSRECKEKACAAVKDYQIEEQWKRVIIKATYFFRPGRKFKDSDNALGCLKSAFDGIVMSGLIPDDSPKYVQHTIPEQYREREIRDGSKKERVEIIIERLD